jgi:protein phosphatase
MTVFGRSDVGMLRHENQDAFGEAPLTRDARLLVVCDGMGGVSGGKEAAETCVSTLLSAFSSEELPDEEALADACFSANLEVLATAKKRGFHRTGTTVVLALAERDAVTLLWVGDSRAYLFDGERLTRLTRDHSYVRELVDAGVITEEEAREHPSRNVITRAVGAQSRIEPETKRIPWREGGRLLLCTDGLHGMVTEREIAEILKEGHTVSRTAHELVCAANSHGGEDNITVLLIENTKENFPDA